MSRQLSARTPSSRGNYSARTPVEMISARSDNNRGGPGGPIQGPLGHTAHFRPSTTVHTIPDYKFVGPPPNQHSRIGERGRAEMIPSQGNVLQGSHHVGRGFERHEYGHQPTYPEPGADIKGGSQDKGVTGVLREVQPEYDNLPPNPATKGQYEQGGGTVYDIPPPRPSQRSQDQMSGNGSVRGNASARSQSDVGTGRVPPGQQNGCYFPEVGNFTLTAVPGYGGFIPGKIAENVISSTYNRSNQLAAVLCEQRGIDDHGYSSAQPRDSNFSNVLAYQNPCGISLPHRRGTDIPGYRGYIPGKYSEGVFGHIYSRANNVSQLIKQRQYQEKADWLRQIYD